MECLEKDGINVDNEISLFADFSVKLLHNSKHKAKLWRVQYLVQV